MTYLINLLGEPSAGKSTTMADLFSTMKYMELTVEICPEWVKRLAYSNIPISKYDQFYITGKEVKQQSRLFNKVDYVISDSPVYLSSFYNFINTGDDTLALVSKRFYDLAKEDGIKVLNILLKRNKTYCPLGRYQTAEEAKEVGCQLEQYLTMHNIEYTFLDCKDNERVQNILSLLDLTK